MRTFLSLLLVVFGFGADVVTVTTGTAGAAGNTVNDLQTYFSAQLLEVAELNTVLDQFGDKRPIPSNSSKTIRFVREEKLSISSTPTQLTEGIAPDAVGISLSEFEATIEQYGTVVRLSDLAEITAKHQVVQRTLYVLGLQAAETYDQLIFNVLNAATNTYFPANAGSDANLTATDTVGYTDLVTLDAALQGSGARPFESGEYVIVTPPQVYASLLKDTTFLQAAQFQAPQRIWKGEVNALGGFRVVRSNAPGFAPFTQAVSGKTSTVYSSFALARFAYQISDLQNVRVYVVAPGGQSDPLQQSRKLGWKFSFKSVITNQNWIQRVRSAGANSVNT